MEAERIGRLIAVLSEAAGVEFDHAAFDGDEDGRQRTIELLESLGHIEARDGAAEHGEDPERAYITAITSLGRIELEDLLRRRDKLEPERPPRGMRGCIAAVLTALGV